MRSRRQFQPTLDLMPSRIAPSALGVSTPMDPSFSPGDSPDADQHAHGSFLHTRRLSHRGSYPHRPGFLHARRRQPDHHDDLLRRVFDRAES